MFIRKLVNTFQYQENILYQDVRVIFTNTLAFVGNRKAYFSGGSNAPVTEFVHKGTLIDFFQESGA